MKRDPFDADNPAEIKFNILNKRIDMNYQVNIPQIFKPIIEACLIYDENLRPSSSQLISIIDNI
jgi:hypothetical protein